MTAVAPTGSLPLVARSACALLLVDYPPQPLAERNERGPVSQLERNLAGLSVDRGVGVDFARPLDAIPRENARIDGWFPVADVAPSVISRRAPPASTTQVSNLLLMTLVNPLPFARLMTIGLHPYIAAYGLSGHTAAASSVGGPVPSAWHGTALHSERSGRHQCARAEGACRQAGDHRFGQHGCSAEPSIVLENGPSFALVNRTRRLLHRPGHKRPALAYKSIWRRSRPGRRGRPSCSPVTRPGASAPTSPTAGGAMAALNCWSVHGGSSAPG
jgi:hypothetical protein